MAFRSKNSKYWQYDFQIRGRRFFGSCGTEDFEEAKAVEAQARFEAKNNPMTRGEFTLSQALGTYFTDICQHQPSARTAKSQASELLKLMPGKTAIQGLTNGDIIRFVSKRRATVTNSTVNRQLQFLGRALRHMEKFYDAKIPQLDLKSAETKEPKERIRELNWDEQARLFEHLRVDLHPFTKFALMTGARRSTITGLRWPDVDLDGGRMRFRLKGGDTMMFPINNEMRALLSTLPKSNVMADRQFVFTFVDQLTADRKRIGTAGKLSADFKTATIIAEIENFRFHDLRHTFATRMLRETGNLKLVSRLLGHKSIDTTMRYAHVLDDDLRHALDNYSVTKPARCRVRR